MFSSMLWCAEHVKSVLGMRKNMWPLAHTSLSHAHDSSPHQMHNIGSRGASGGIKAALPQGFMSFNPVRACLLRSSLCLGLVSHEAHLSISCNYIVALFEIYSPRQAPL